MEITRAYLESFGKYKNKEIEFTPGVNLIFGNNEKGKSTIHGFIESMMYSLNTYQFQTPDQLDKFSRYQPWNDKEHFSGELEYNENDSLIRIKRNFLIEDGIDLYINGEKTDANHVDIESFVANEEQKGMLRVLGITDISNKTGGSLVNEMKDIILNVKNSNSGIRSAEESVDEIKTIIHQIEESPEYLALFKQQGYYQESLNESLAQQQKKKGYIQLYFDKIRQIKTINEEILALDKVIKEKEQEDNLKRYYKLIQKNDEINGVKEEVAILEPYSTVTAVDIEAYQKEIMAIDNLKKKINGIDEEAKEAKLRRYKITLDIPRPTMELLIDFDFTGSFIASFSDVLKIQDKLDDLKQSVINYEEKLIEVDGTHIFSSGEARARKEKLEKDYDKFVNMVSWKNQIVKEDTLDDSKDKAFKKLIALQGKESNLTIGIHLTQVLILLCIVVTLPNLSWVFMTGIVAMLSLVAMILFFVKRKSIVKELTQYEHTIKNVQEELAKYHIRLEKADSHINEMIRLYHCKTEDDMQQLYIKKISDYDNISIYRHELGILQKQEKEVLDSLKIEEFAIKKYFERLDIFSKGKVELSRETYEKLLRSIAESKECMYLEETIIGYELDIDSNYEALSKKEEVIKESKVYLLGVHSLESLETKQQDYKERLDWIKEQLEEKERILAGNVEEKLLTLGKDLEYLGYKVQENVTQSVEELRLKNQRQQEQLIEVTSDMNQAKIEADFIGNNQMAPSLIIDKMKEVDDKIERFKKRIKLYENTLEYLILAGSGVEETFKVELRETIRKIISQVTGKNHEVLIEEDMNLKVFDRESGKTVNLENMSMGTIDQIYFALRIGLVSSMNQTIRIPLILDDCFVYYDDARCKQMLKQVAELDRQVIMLSCHEREKRFFEELKININYIEL